MLDRIAQEREIYIINRPDGENIALIPESDLNSLIETVYLFRSPANARRLLDAIEPPTPFIKGDRSSCSRVYTNESSLTRKIIRSRSLYI